MRSHPTTQPIEKETTNINYKMVVIFSQKRGKTGEKIRKKGNTGKYPGKQRKTGENMAKQEKEGETQKNRRKHMKTG